MLTTLTNCRASSIQGALQPAWQGPLPARFALAVADRNSGALRITVPGREPVVIQSSEAWGALFPQLRIVEKAQGVTFGPRLALLVGESVQLGPAHEVEAALATPRSQAGTTGTDRTDEPKEAPHITDTTAWTLLKNRSFSPVLIYGKSAPRGVYFIGVEDQDGVLAILDGPHSLGSPVPLGNTHAMLNMLLKEALAIPSSAGMLIDVRTHRIYAVTRAALDAAMITQRRPVRRESTALVQSVIAVPTYVHAIGQRAGALNRETSTVGRTFALGAFLLCVLVAFFLTALMKKLSVDPIYDFLATADGLRVFDSSEMSVILPLAMPLIGGAAISVAFVLAWLPTMSQHLSFFLAGTQPWVVWLFWVTTLFDVSINTRFWITVGFPGGFPNGYGMIPDMLIASGITTVMVMVSLAISIGTEFLVGLLVATAWALRPGAAAAVRELILGVIRAAYGLWYGVQGLLDEARSIGDGHAGYLGAHTPTIYLEQVEEGVYEEQSWR